MNDFLVHTNRFGGAIRIFVWPHACDLRQYAEPQQAQALLPATPMQILEQSGNPEGPDA